MRKNRKVINKIFVSFAIGFVLFLFITAIFWFLDNNKSYLSEQSFDSIDNLHSALVKTMNSETSESIDYWICDLVTYFEIEDVVVFLSTYSSTKTGALEEDTLFVQFAKKKGNEYYLLTPKAGFGQFAELRLSDEYTLGGNYWYYANVRINGVKKSICFLYKDINEEKKIYFDSIETKEIEICNPFNQESFYICYAISYYDSLFDKVFKNYEKRHIVELK